MAVIKWSPFRRLVQFVVNAVAGCAYYYGVFPETSKNSSGKLVGIDSSEHIKPFFKIDNWVYFGGSVIASGHDSVFMVNYGECNLLFDSINYHMADALVVGDYLHVLTVSAAFDTRKLYTDDKFLLKRIKPAGASGWIDGAGCKVWKIALASLTGASYSVTAADLVADIDFRYQTLTTPAGVTTLSGYDTNLRWYQGIPSLDTSGNLAYYAINVNTSLSDYVYVADTKKIYVGYDGTDYTYSGIASTLSSDYGIGESYTAGVAASGSALGVLGSVEAVKYALLAMLPPTAPTTRRALKPFLTYLLDEEVALSLVPGGDLPYVFRHIWVCSATGTTGSNATVNDLSIMFTIDLSTTPPGFTPKTSFSSGTATFTYVGTDSSVVSPTNPADTTHTYYPGTSKTSAAAWAEVEPAIGTELKTNVTYQGHHEIGSLIDYGATLYDSFWPDSFSLTLPSPVAPVSTTYLSPSRALSDAEIAAGETSLSSWYYAWPPNMVRFHVVGVYGYNSVTMAEEFVRYYIVPEARLYAYATGVDTPGATSIYHSVAHSASVLAGDYRGDAITFDCDCTASGGIGESGTSGYAPEISTWPVPVNGSTAADILHAMFPASVDGATTATDIDIWSVKWSVNVGLIKIAEIVYADSEYKKEPVSRSITYTETTSLPFYDKADETTGGTYYYTTYGFSEHGGLCHYPSKSSITSNFTVAQSGDPYRPSFTVTHHLNYTLNGTASAVDYAAISGTATGDSGNSQLTTWAMAPIDAGGSVAIYSYIFYADTWPLYPTGSGSSGSYVNEHFYSSLEGQLTGIYGVTLGSANNLPYSSKDDTSKSFLHLGVLY